MKNLSQIQKARKTLRLRIVENSPALTPEQLALLYGMLNALVWVCDAPDCTTMDRVLAGEPFAFHPPATPSNNPSPNN